MIAHPEEFIPLVPSLLRAKAVAVRLRASEGDPGDITYITLAADGLDPVCIHCRAFLPEGRELLRTFFAQAPVAVFHDAKEDLRSLAELDILPKALFDAKLAAHLLHTPEKELRLDLASLALACLGIPEPRCGDFPGVSPGQDSDSLLRNDALAAKALLRLREALIPLLVENGLVRVAEIEFQCAKALARMEYTGIHLEREQWARLLERKQEERGQALDALYAFTGRPAVQGTLWGGETLYGPNFDSNVFVLKLLKDHGISVSSTSRRQLSPHRHEPLVAALINYRKAAKAISAFLEPFPALLGRKTGRLHPRYQQITAMSGRMSCSNPNIQQIPRDREFRECFTAPPGRSLVVADYSQIELRVAAQISGDQRMLDAYRKGEDLHLLTASYLANKPMALVSKQERQAYKAVNLGLVYGMGARGLQESARMSYGVEMSLEDAVRFRDRFFATYTGITRWHQGIKADASPEGRTLTGRRFPYRPEAGLPERSNLPVQGSAADIIKKALGLLVNRLHGSDIHIVAVVHDEILLECPGERAQEAVAALKRTMEEAAAGIMPDVPTPVAPIISASWAEK